MSNNNYMEKYEKARKEGINATTLQINRDGTLYEPAVLDDFELTMERKGVPSKLTFTLLKDGKVNFVEGDAVRFRISRTWLFYGFIFERKTDEDGNIKCTCYDQIRYLKNKDTYIYQNKTATELIKMIAKDFNLNLGSIEDTKYKIAQRVEKDTSLIDMILNALDETLMMTGKLYVLYDDFGKLTLKNIENMAFDLLIDESTIKGYEYTASIDDEVYNKIKLVYENSGTGKSDLYIAQDSKNIKQWGVLQLYKKLDSNVNAKAMADELLELYNKTKRNININDALGDVRVRAGTRIITNLDLGDYKLKSYMIVETIKHKYKKGEYTMDLTLINKDFSASSYQQSQSNNDSSESSSGGGSSSGVLNGRTVNAEFSAYYPSNDPMQGGFHAAYKNEKLNPASNTCAAPPQVDFGMYVQVLGTGTSKDGQTFRVNDRGSKIKILSDGTYRFDLLFPDRKSAYAFGRRRGKAIIGSGFTSASGGNPRAVQLAKSKLGCKYVWGATGPNTFDCSGLMYWVAKQLGKSIPRTSREQSKGGVGVSKSNLMPGDLVFFGNPVHHVGMYIGNNQFIHSPQTGDVVKISSLSSRKDYHNARRYF